jgi:hypothetical protein
MWVRDVPWEQAIPLRMQPRLASWNRRDDPDQLRLTGYLDHVEALLRPFMSGLAPADLDNPGLGFGLTVGLPPEMSLTEQGRRDLDNYLHPVVQRLGHARFSNVCGRKIHGSSSVVVFPSRALVSPAGHHVQVRPRGSYEKPSWKTGIHSALVAADVRPVPAGGVHLDVRFTVGRGRNWTALWKPTIDALTPILGTSHPGSFNLNDERITEIGLHQHVEPSLGHDVIIDLWWDQEETT